MASKEYTPGLFVEVGAKVEGHAGGVTYGAGLDFFNFFEFAVVVVGAAVDDVVELLVVLEPFTVVEVVVVEVVVVVDAGPAYGPT